MQQVQDGVVMDFGPILFGGEDGSASAASNADADTTNDVQTGAAADSDQFSADNLEDKSCDQTGVSESSLPNQEESGFQSGHSATQAKAGKAEVGIKALSSAKAAVKIFVSINGYDEQSANQRTVVRDLMLKQSQAMELKLEGKKPLEGEDFDAIAKQLRRENNRLDSLLEGKESLFGKARKAAELAIEHMQQIITDINRLEEEG